MPFDDECLDVYQLALNFLTLADEVEVNRSGTWTGTGTWTRPKTAKLTVVRLALPEGLGNGMVDVAMAKSVETQTGLIEKRVLIQASPAVIYLALTEARELMRWFCDRATSDPRVGGELQASWRSGKTEQKGRAVFTQIIPEELVELRWIDEGQGVTKEEARHLLSYRIRARRRTSEVVMRDDDSPTDDETFAVLREGWNSVLLELKDYCERRERSLKPRPVEQPSLEP